MRHIYRKQRVRHCEPFRLIGANATSYTGSEGTINWKWYVADPRIWVKVGVLFVPNDGITPPAVDSGGYCRLWLSWAERARASSQGPAGRPFPVGDLVGTSAAPLDFPVNAALFGHFTEARSGADVILGRLQISAPTTEGNWWAHASYWPSADVTEEEWEELSADAVSGSTDGLSGPSVIWIP